MFEASRQRGTRASVPTAAGRLIRPTNGSWPRSSATLTLLEDRRSVAARCPRSVYVRRNGHDDLGANDRFAVPDAGRLFIASATMQSHGSKIGLAAHLRERSVAIALARRGPVSDAKAIASVMLGFRATGVRESECQEARLGSVAGLWLRRPGRPACGFCACRLFGG
jgi:hypothetical protein